MHYPNFCGSAYTSQSKAAAGDRSVNLYVEVIESGTGKDGAIKCLVGTPGYRALVTLPDSPVKCIYSGDGGSVFAVAGHTLFQILQRTPPVCRLPYDELRNLIIEASGGTTGPIQTATQTAAQWAANYVTVTAENPPDPSTYGFGAGQVYGTSTPVTVDQWLPLFMAPASYLTLGTIPLPDGAATKAQLFANGNSLFLVMGQNGYVVGAIGAPLVQVTAAVMGAYIDGYYIALNPDGTQFHISMLYDGATWDALDYASPNAEPDAAIAILEDHRQLWIFGQQSIEVWGDAGNPLFAFQRNPGGFLEQGCAAPWSPVRLNDSVFWLGSDERGGRVFWQAQGYQPVRVSNHAVEAAWAKYPYVADAETYGYQDGGHSFCVIHFPSANPNPTPGGPALGATWVYDCTASAQIGLPQWHERAYWDPVHGVWGMWRPRCHTYAWGMHLVGDWQTGMIYRLSPAYRSDDGNPLRWLRSAPHVSSEMHTVFYDELLIDMQVGVGLNDDVAVVNTSTTLESTLGINDSIAQMNADVAGGGQPTTIGQAGKTPQVCLRISRDGGNKWGPERWVSAGAIGQYLARVRFTRLGRARDFVAEVSGSDPVPVALIAADLRVTPGNGS